MEAFNKVVSGAAEGSSGGGGQNTRAFVCKRVCVRDATFPVTHSLAVCE